MSLWCQCCSTPKRTVPTDYGNVCSDCGNTILRNLRQIEACLLALSAVPVVGAGQRRAPGYGSRSPARDNVIAETDPRSRADDDGNTHALAALTGWTRLVARERRETQPWHVTISGECDWLRTRHPWILAQDWVDAYATELDDVRRRVQQLVGLAPEPPVGRCLSVTRDGDCGGPVYTTPDRDGVRCTRCGRLYTGLDLARFHVVQRTAQQASLRM